MLRNFLSVGFFTALSRLTGFLSIVMVSAIMGNHAVADAFFVALRLPNTFRTVFGEGAFSAAYVPAYSKVLETRGKGPASDFAGRIFTILLIAQIVLLVAFYFDTSAFLALLAPGFLDDPRKYAAVTEMSWITFPYLAFVSIAILHTGTLNAHGHFATGAAASILLNLSVMAFLGVSHLFSNPGIAASWGVLVSGVAQFALLRWDARRHGLLEKLRKPVLNADTRGFFKALGPAVLGSAGQQIAVFLDTILASWLPSGSVAALNYAERLYQFPLGVIGVAAGTVLLPEMSRKIAGGDPLGASRAQNRSIALTLALTAPFIVLFLMIPEEVVRGAYKRGAFDADAAHQAGLVLAAYAFGLMPMVLIRSLTASFQSRGNTAIPTYCYLAGLAVNLALKMAFYKTSGPAGLAAATAVGAWINFALLVAWGMLRDWFRPDPRLVENVAIIVFSCGVLALLCPLYQALSARYVDVPIFNDTVTVAFTCLAIAANYAALYFFGAWAYGNSMIRQLR